MNHKKSLQKQLAFQTIHNVSVSKMGQAILKKNPYETRVLTDKLGDIEFRQKKWKNDFSWRMNETRQEFKQTRNMETSLRVRPYYDSKGGKTILSPDRAQERKRNFRIYQQLRKPSAVNPSLTESPKKDGAIAYTSAKKKTLTTDIKAFLGDKISSPKGNSRRGTVTPHCMTPFIRHSFNDCSDETATGDVTNCLKCKNCDAVVVQEKTDTQENGNYDIDTLSVSAPSRQESQTVLKSSQVTTTLLSQKPSHIWKTRTGEIIWKQRVVSGFLKREKLSNLLNGNSELGAGQSSSPVKDARFLGLQSLLVPLTNSVREVKDKVEDV